MVMLFKLSEIPAQERTPLVEQLLEIIQLQAEQIQQLKDEIAILKGLKARPKIKPSKLDEQTSEEQKETDGEKQTEPASRKRSKTASLEIHETKILSPEVKIPEGSKFKGYDDYVVQDLIIQAHNVRYRLERWQTPEGTYIVGQLPGSVEGGHFGPTLVSYILYQHYHCQVTQPLLLEQLSEWGIDISAGQLSRLLIEDNQTFHVEKDGVLRAGLEVSTHVTVDDTGARHAGKNGHCTHIGNDYFAWFQSTEHKSRINFLELLRAGHTDYRIDAEAMAYMQSQNIRQSSLEKLASDPLKIFSDKAQWEIHLQRHSISGKRCIRIATEGALVGSVLSHDFRKDVAIISDDAGQFNILLHGLCWVHAERTIHKLIPVSDAQREAVASMRSRIWGLYADLKAYKQAPSNDEKAQLEARFEEIFTTKTCYQTLNGALQRLHANKAELLLVLERPDVPLHTNGSERDIRDYVKKGKVSGGARSENGRQSRDTFTSLKKTCRKTGLSFWKYLTGRLSRSGLVPLLPDLIRQRATGPMEAAPV